MDLKNFSTLDAKGNRLVDFGRAGNLDEKILPRNIKKIFHRAGDQSARLQEAIDTLKEWEVLEINSGVWELSKPLVLTRSNIGITGVRNPVLKAMWTRQDTILTIRGPGWQNNRSKPAKIKGDVLVGARSITLEKAAEFRAGDAVIIRQNTNQEYINELGMEQYGWRAKNFKFIMDRTVVDARDKTIVLDDDSVVELKPEWGTSEIVKYADARIKNILISNLEFDSVAADEKDEAHAKSAIDLYNCRNVTIRGIDSKVVQTLVYADYSARFITISGCHYSNPASQDLGQRRYAYYINGTNCLVEECYADAARHAFVSGSCALGPNVFYKCTADNELNDSGPHHRHAAGFLYDNVDAYIRVQNRGDRGSGQGIAGVWHVLWNTSKEKPVAISSLSKMFINLGIGISDIDAKFLSEDQGERFAGCLRKIIPSPVSLFKYQNAKVRGV